MRGIKALLGASALFVSLALVPQTKAQVSIGVNLGGPPPACQWGYYDYPPYSCAPYGFYGPGYFYNGIFLGVGPWHNWGYAHGWGGHRFAGARGGHYVPGAHGGYAGHGAVAAHGRPGSYAAHGAPAHGAMAHGAVHATAHAAPHGGGGHAVAAHGGGGHGGGDHR